MGLYELRTVYAPAPGRNVHAWMDDASCRVDRWDLMDTDMQQRTCVGVRCGVSVVIMRIRWRVAAM